MKKLLWFVTPLALQVLVMVMAGFLAFHYTTRKTRTPAESEAWSAFGSGAGQLAGLGYSNLFSQNGVVGAQRGRELTLFRDAKTPTATVQMPAGFNVAFALNYEEAEKPKAPPLRLPIFPTL